MRFELLMPVLALLLFAGNAQAQTAANDCAETKTQLTRAQTKLNDWPALARYHDANVKVVPPAKNEARVVFMGDSITDSWDDQKYGGFFPGKPYIDRGISGQTTPQMLARFRQDVIDLHPAVVQIMAGTNDIAGNTGPMTPEETQANIRSMVELAHAHGIRVILASIPPADMFPWKPGLDPGGKIAAMNAWLKAYAVRAGCIHADYWSAMKDNGLGMRGGLSSDHVHPTRAGYAVMAPVAEAAIKRALARPAPRKSAVD